MNNFSLHHGQLEYKEFRKPDKGKKSGREGVGGKLLMSKVICLSPTISYLESSSPTAHAGSRPLVKGNEDAGYEGGVTTEFRLLVVPETASNKFLIYHFHRALHISIVITGLPVPKTSLTILFFKSKIGIPT